MAANAVIGALRVVLGADTAALDNGLKEARSRLAQFSAGVGKSMAVAGAAMSAVAVGMAVSVKGAIDEADKFGKMAQSIGVPVEELSKLRHAADLSGVELETLSKGIGRLNRNLVESAQGLKTPQRAFDALGIAIKNADGSIKSVSQILPDLAEKFSKMRDGPEKTAFAMQLLGRAGAEMIPLLNAGKAGLADMMAEAQALGLVIDEKTSKAAEAFNDNLTRLGRVKDGIVTQITARLVPALAALSQVMIDAAKDSSLMQQAADGIAAVLKGAINAAMTAVTVFQRLAVEASALWQMLSATSFADMKAGWKSYQDAGAQTAITIGALQEKMRQFWTDAEERAAKAPDAANRTFKPIIQNATEAEAALKKLAIQAEQAVQKAVAFGQRVFEQTRTPAEAYANTIEKLNLHYRTGFIDADTYARAVAQAQDRMISASPIASQLGSALENVFDRATQGGMKFGDILKSLAHDLAKMAQQSLFKSLIYGNVGGNTGGGGIIGSLFKAFIPGIPGFANGGSFTVPGPGGIDSQLAMMRVTPGERVTVTKKGEGGSGVVNNYNYTVHAPGATPEAVALAFKEIQRLRAETPSIAVSAISRAREVAPGMVR